MPVTHTCTFTRIAGLFIGTMLALPIAAQAADTEPGYEYTFHHIELQNEDFSSPEERRHTTRYAQQGSHHAALWSEQERVGDYDSRVKITKADYATGLLIPWWDTSLSSDEEEGWSLWDSGISYETFDAELAKGDQPDQEIAGAKAKHYILSADFVFDSERNAVLVRQKIQADLWVHDDKPFTSAVFGGFNAFEDPRLNTFLQEELEEKGFVVRAETVNDQSAMETDGTEVDEPLREYLLSYVSDLKPIDVMVFDPPVVSPDRLGAVQGQFREDEEESCRTLVAGEAPDYFHDHLDDRQLKAVVPELKKICEELLAQQDE